jgi:hypothetical protein
MKKKSVALLIIFGIMLLVPTFSFARNIDGFSFSTVTASSYTSTGYVAKTGSSSVPAVVNLTTGSPNAGYVQHGHNIDCELIRGFYDDSGHGSYWEERYEGSGVVSPGTRTTIGYNNSFSAGFQVDLGVSVITSTDPNYYHQVSGSWSPDSY